MTGYEWIPLAVGAIAAGTSAATSIDSARSGKNARKRQQQAQDQSLAQAQSQKRENAMAQNKANRKKPDIGAIMASAQSAGGGGVQSTFLTGGAGTNKLGA